MARPLEPVRRREVGWLWAAGAWLGALPTRAISRFSPRGPLLGAFLGFGMVLAAVGRLVLGFLGRALGAMGARVREVLAESVASVTDARSGSFAEPLARPPPGEEAFLASPPAGAASGTSQ